MATIQEVAEHAGVSVGSVSRYLNGHKLREENVKKIEAAIKELNYTENFFAKGMKSNQTRSIGLLINNMQSNFSASLVAWIDDILERHNYTILLSSYRDDPSRIEQKIDYFRSRSVEGLIVVGIEKDWEQVSMLNQIDIPIISIITPLDLPRVDSIIVDNRVSTEKVISKMIDLNHNRIGVIAAPQTDYVSRERLQGVFDAFKSHNKVLPEELVFYGDYSKESGSRGMDYLLSQETTAVFVCNYNMSLGALQRIHEQKIEIGKDISFASYDYFDASDIFSPKLTVIKQRVAEIGSLAADRILEKIRNNNRLKEQTLIVANDILWRDSIVKIKDKNEDI
ncbi:LacI family DNA-binding transcriptional regulator [Vagococcus elongatus]|uniref:LacI family transcriptional regulator n=1 Tax=Vagococcus elongatus TaxID=180344 RepID=A0A430ANV2_9ENTE|nr:LacI family DNA-binding transcriptional regulator [Vagococcus elongatus]RSU09818.1 LacI family transcriptional regulator [Vagococcus elongatus]